MDHHAKLRDIIGGIVSDRLKQPVIVTRHLGIAEVIDNDGDRTTHVIEDPDTTMTDDIGLSRTLSVYVEGALRHRTCD